MKLINRDTDYAIKALMHMARNSGKTSVTELAAELDMPRPFLRKILQILNKKGILHSYKGKGGGFLLALPPEEIYLTDLINTFQGQVNLIQCLFKKQICSDVKTCVLREKINVLEKHVISEQSSITLASLIEEEPHQKNGPIIKGEKKL